MLTSSGFIWSLMFKKKFFKKKGRKEKKISLMLF